MILPWGSDPRDKAHPLAGRNEERTNMVETDNTTAQAMRSGMVTADEIAPCPFCGLNFVKPPEAVTPIVFHLGLVADGKCVLSGMGFREHQFALLNARHG